MPEECNNNKITFKIFFNSFDRSIVLSFCLISLILNLIIIITILLEKNKKISLVMRITQSILIVNFINIFSYSFQWVICKNEIESNTDDGPTFNIALLVGDSNHLFACKIQSFILLASSLSQDYLVILFFFIVNKKNIINTFYINIFIVLSIFIPLIVSFFYAVFDSFGISEDFCYIKKFKYLDTYLYEADDNYILSFIPIYGLRIIDFSISMILFIKIYRYIKKEKSISYIIDKLSMLFIQLFKLFIILFYRITNLFWKEYPKGLKKMYIILSTLDGLLLPLAFSYSNDIFCNFFNLREKSRKNTDIEKDLDVDNITISPKEDNLEGIGFSNIYGSNNFNLSY